MKISLPICRRATNLPRKGYSELAWDQFSGWNLMAKCYVLVLLAGPILAIPQTSVPMTQTTKFETLLRKHIDK